MIKEWKIKVNKIIKEFHMKKKIGSAEGKRVGYQKL